MSPWLKTFPPLKTQMAKARRTPHPQHVEALNEFISITRQSLGSDEGARVLELDPEVSESMLLGYIQGAVEYIKHLQSKVAANQPQPYIHDASSGGFPIGNPDLLYGPPGDD